MGKDYPDNSSERHMTDMNRRAVLAATTASISAGAVGGSMLGTVAADHEDDDECPDNNYESYCTGDDNFDEDNSYHWVVTDEYYTQEYCGSSRDSVNRAQLAADIIYYGSVKDDTGVWHHSFTASGHSEGWRYETPINECEWPEDFCRYSNILRSYQYWENQEPGETTIEPESGSSVKGWPASDTSDDSDLHNDLLLTALAEGIGAAGAWPMSAAISFAAVMVDHYENREKNENTREYNWFHGDYWSGVPCASNFVLQHIESDPGEDDSVDFTYYNTHHMCTNCDVNSDYRWVQVSTDVSYYNAKDGSASSSTTSSDAPSARIGGSFPSTRVEPGDIVERDDGQLSQVDSVKVRTENFPGTSPEERSVDNLPGALQRHVADQETATLRRFPAEVVVTTASGVMI